MKTLILSLVMTLVFGTVLQARTTKNEEIKLLVNQQKTVTKDKLTLKFISVLEDSRCPEGTNCVWAGNAKLQIKLSNQKGKSKTFELNIGIEPQIISFEGYEIKVIDLTPKPRTNIRINRKGYTAIFTVSCLKK